jgi:hypothetical protein
MAQMPSPLSHIAPKTKWHAAAFSAKPAEHFMQQPTVNSTSTDLTHIPVQRKPTAQILIWNEVVIIIKWASELTAVYTGL